MFIMDTMMTRLERKGDLFYPVLGGEAFFRSSIDKRKKSSCRGGEKQEKLDMRRIV